jgi:hypothetical protein
MRQYTTNGTELTSTNKNAVLLLDRSNQYDNNVNNAMEKKHYEFEAEIQKTPDIDGAYVAFPYDIKKEFGRGRVKVCAEFDGEPYMGSIVNMGIKNNDGSICYIIGIRKDIRQKIGKQAGDKVKVTIINER